jgi:hypothetical protein
LTFPVIESRDAIISKLRSDFSLWSRPFITEGTLKDELVSISQLLHRFGKQLQAVMQGRIDRK